MNSQSRTLNAAGLTRRSGRVPATIHSGYTAWMRYLGLALVTAIAVVVLAGNAQPPSTNRSSDVEVPTQTPHWNGIYAATFPGCVGAGSFIPARIVVVPRDGRAHTVRYDDATVALIDGTWDNTDPSDDLFTIGKCAR